MTRMKKIKITCPDLFALRTVFWFSHFQQHSVNIFIISQGIDGRFVHLTNTGTNSLASMLFICENPLNKMKLNYKKHKDMKQKPSHRLTLTSLHGINCLCVSNYNSAGSRTEHLGALQWNTLWMNSVLKPF